MTVTIRAPREWRQVSCPRCGSWAWERCITPGARYLPRPHRVRVDLAARNPHVDVTP